MNPLLSPLKTWGTFLLLVVSGFGFASTGVTAAKAQESELPVLFDTRERLPRPDLSNLVRLRILTTADFPPFNFADQTGRLAGFNVDLAREVCLELRIEAKCQIQALPFGELETALANRAGEAVMAGIAITAERRNRFSFSRPYLTIPARFARNVARDLRGEGAEALSGRPVGVVKDTAHEAMLKSFFPKIIPVVFDDREAMLQALKEDKVAAVFSDGLQLPFWLAGEASEKCCVLFGGPYLSRDYLGEGMAVLLRNDEETLAAAFDHALATLSRNGRLQDIYLRYFPHGLY
ncbi:transporter substrate-binding domain-containing protein [Neorhizobium sp. T786]|uniref:transporter substrate-binding domain-containing protein n=1 Tax=Pseudorhizobium xiangyangii TaxID=2883104 RepID=UPI001CFF990E|nr:transporter substrate-binding domain-containing protein [Neorhizobium xiangyangii]MCB5202525.1 transporter substrate-binding domain-containing protein [Neorhizobium xiangyangii]